MYWDCPRMWPGTTVYIIGGGPSINKTDINLLRGQKVIGTNDAFKYWPWIPINYSMDERWYNWNAQEYKAFGNIKVNTSATLRHYLGLKFLDQSKLKTLDDRPGFINKGNNSGFGAVNLAWKLGASKIILLGFDMNFVDGAANYHTNHKLKVAKTIYTHTMKSEFEKFAPQYKEANVEIINATPGSFLEAFPIVSPEEVLP